MFVAMATFASIMLLWQRSQSTTTPCATSYSQPGHVLSNHAIRASQAASSVECTDKCGADPTCHSINWYPGRGLCELNNATHLSSPEDLIPTNQGAYLIYLLHPMAVCSNKLCSGSLSCLMNSDGINYQCQDCDDALGMEDRRITDSQITASSMYDSYHAPSMARLHNSYLGPHYRGAWSSGNVTAGEYLQIDLRRVVHLSKVATQGRPVEYYQFVTKYSLQYSLDGTNWSWVRQDHNIKEFPGNSDRDSVVNNAIPDIIKAKYIRIVALTWNEHISMRAELYGCDSL